LHNLALIKRRKGHLTKAEATFQLSLKIFEKAFGTRVHESVAATLANIALVRRDRGDLDGALLRLEDVLGIQEKLYGTRRHPAVATTLAFCAMVKQKKGDFGGALSQFEEAVSIKKDAASEREQSLVCIKEDGASQREQSLVGIKKDAASKHEHDLVADMLQRIAQIKLAKGDMVGALEQFVRLLRVDQVASGTREYGELASPLEDIARFLRRRRALAKPRPGAKWSLYCWGSSQATLQ